ncbi:MAG: 3-deoxy-7-phosphoheptulonate synthase [Proteobacteria bacterium]|nr:MAG: 3-deoxy-7-phosphoheptulonate synthase [Pseudomonadota bacterium]
MQRTADLHVASNRVLPAPAELLRELPASDAQSELVARARREIREVLFGADRRLLLIVGPCSIHDVDAGREYAQRLAALARGVAGRILVAMRVYFEKPRTTIGWKGLVMDPHLDGSADIPAGLRLARALLRDVLDLGLPTATELLDPITPQYLADLVCWSAIGARTTESQTHRQMASGLSMPIGFKNGTDGSVTAAIHAIQAARQPQTFLGVSTDGRASAVTTTGNPDCHVVLRGGRSGPNYGAEHVAAAARALADAGLAPAVVVDCSHDNSGKQPERQCDVLRDVVAQVAAGGRALVGAMLESNLEPGSQPFPAPPASLRRGVSITDACLGWADTERAVRETHARLAR